MAAAAPVDTGEGNEALQTVAPKAPVTYERPVSTHNLGIRKPRTSSPFSSSDETRLAQSSYIFLQHCSSLC